MFVERCKWSLSADGGSARPMNSAELLPGTAGVSSVVMKAGKPMGRRWARSSADAPAVQEFHILKHQTARQSGRTINLLVRYRYRAGLEQAAYPDYRDLCRAALPYLAVRPEQPSNEYWEVLNEGLVREPGCHNSIVTIASVSPISFAGMTESP